jgi:biopolymer transport protein ExbB/TolQ
MLTQKLLSLALIGTEWIMWLLFILSILSWTVILERYWILRQKRGNSENLRQKLFSILKKKDFNAIELLLHNDRSSLAEVTLIGLRNMHENGIKFEESLSIALSEEKVMLEGRIAILGTLGSNAPFIGLFGTVLGVIHAFHSLALDTSGGPAVVMAGISEALVATALGLFVAIPAVAAYNYFVRSIKKIMINSENFAKLVTFAYTDKKTVKD